MKGQERKGEREGRSGLSKRRKGQMGNETEDGRCSKEVRKKEGIEGHKVGKG